MSKGTPGPWTVEFKKNCDWVIYGSDGYSILSIPYDEDYGNPKADAANARLIASTPSLLSAMHMAMSFLLEPKPNVEAAKRELLSAIDKAEGGK